MKKFNSEGLTTMDQITRHTIL